MISSSRSSPSPTPKSSPRRHRNRRGLSLEQLQQIALAQALDLAAEREEIPLPGMGLRCNRAGCPAEVRTVTELARDIEDHMIYEQEGFGATCCDKWYESRYDWERHKCRHRRTPTGAYSPLRRSTPTPTGDRPNSPSGISPRRTVSRRSMIFTEWTWDRDLPSANGSPDGSPPRSDPESGDSSPSDESGCEGTRKSPF